MTNKIIHSRYEILEEQNYTILKPSNNGDDFIIKVYELFKGVTISFHKIRCEFLPDFLDLSQKNVSDNFLVVNYCINGQCEMLLSNNTFVHQKLNDFSITDELLQDGHTYPKKYYDGVEFFIDLEEVQENSSLLKETFDIDFEHIKERFFEEQRFFISACPLPLKGMLYRLWNLAKGSDNIIEMKIFATQLFYRLGFIEFAKVKYTYLTLAQNTIAKQCYKIITDDISRSYSARELALNFKISETSLKTYFKAVYGESLPAFIKNLRLETAADMLIQTKQSVNDIANSVGYLSQSKFASAFKEHFNLTPLEYRKQKLLNLI